MQTHPSEIRTCDTFAFGYANHEFYNLSDGRLMVTAKGSKSVLGVFVHIEDALNFASLMFGKDSNG